MPNSIKYLLFTLLGLVLIIGIISIPYLKRTIFEDMPIKTSIEEFEKMAYNGDVERVRIDRSIVEITLTDEALQKQPYQKLFEDKQEAKAHYFFTITRPESFQDAFFNSLQANLPPKKRIKYDIGQDADVSEVIWNWGGILIIILIGLLLIVPIYLLIFKLIKRI